MFKHTVLIFDVLFLVIGLLYFVSLVFSISSLPFYFDHLINTL